METQTLTLAEAFLELANHYPSPHNGQPIRLLLTSDGTYDLYFQRERGLQAADISYIFSFVSMGVFVEHLQLCAQALGHGFSYELQLPAEADLHGEGAVRFGSCHISWNTTQPDARLRTILQNRQTSRKKYHTGPPAGLAEQLAALAAADHMQLRGLDAAGTRQAIWLNQRAVFDDMSDEPVRRELDHWLRYTATQKQQMRDGLSYDCMELNGPLMRFFVHHPGLLRAPGISALLKQYYLRTMTDSSQVFYMLAPFATGQDSFHVGQMVMRQWRAVAAAGCYLHPFGTIMSNHAAHRDFLELAGVEHESREQGYLVFIFRCGISEPPVPSLRLPYQTHLLMKEV